MLQDITKKLHETAGAVDIAYSEVMKKQSLLDGKEASLAAREEVVIKKETDLKHREIAVASIEDVVAYRKEAGVMADQAAKEKSALAEAKALFNKESANRTALMDSQVRANQAEAKRLADLKTQLDAERAQLDIDKENYKEDVIRNIAKGVVATIKK